MKNYHDFLQIENRSKVSTSKFHPKNEYYYNRINGAFEVWIKNNFGILHISEILNVPYCELVDKAVNWIMEMNPDIEFPAKREKIEVVNTWEMMEEKEKINCEI